jgi:hypothetical protein
MIYVVVISILVLCLVFRLAWNLSIARSAMENEARGD